MKPVSLPSPESGRAAGSADETAATGPAYNEFISAASHELRTPLTSICGALNLIVSGAAGTLPDKALALLTIAHRNSQRLVHIVDDILDAEKIESGKMRINLQKVVLAAFLQETITYNEPYAHEFNVRFSLQDTPPDIVIMADPDRLMQVMTNLLSNAAKFSPPESESLVRAYETGGKVVIEVQDFGPGIPEEFQPYVFEKFAQACSAGVRHPKGTGLGLNLSRQLVELMRGEIGFKTGPGEGTTFFVRLPKAESGAA